MAQVLGGLFSNDLKTSPSLGDLSNMDSPPAPQPLIADIIFEERAEAGACENCDLPYPARRLNDFPGPGGAAAWVPPAANSPPKKAKVNWDHTARWMPGFAFPRANYGTTLDKSQHML